MRTTSSGIHIRSDDDEKNVKGGAASHFSLSPTAPPPPLSLSLSISLSPFLFPSLSEEAIQVVDLLQAGVDPHTQDTPFKIKKNLELLGAKRACGPEEELTPKHPRQSFHFWP